MPDKKQPLSPPPPSLTNSALEKLNEVIKANQGPVAGLRLHLAGRMEGNFQHLLSIVEKGQEAADDIAFHVPGLPVAIFLEGHNAEYLGGVEINYEYKGPDRSGLEYKNPNPLWHGETEKQIQAIIDNELNPAIAQHGGYISLIALTDAVAYIEMGGGCQGCGMADVTLKQGIEASIVGVVPGVERLVDTTDHDAGTNPFYQPTKK